MKNLNLLWQRALDELSVGCCTSAVDDTLSKEYVVRRVSDEGLSFYTITLPAFGSDLQKVLESGQVDPSHFAGFRRRGMTPQFLGGFMDLIVDRKTGRLLDSPNVAAIHAVRQLTLMFNKILLPCSDAREREAMWGYVQCEKEVKDGDSRRLPEQYARFRRISRILWRDILLALDERVYQGELVPRHGPGATADRLRGNLKFVQHEWPARLDEAFPAEDYLIPNIRYWEEIQPDRVTYLEPGAERPVRVISVPKTLKTPRIIAVEPTCMQYTQQALMHALVPSIVNHPVLGKMVGFDDQVPNQDLAREGSLTGALATLDLSEASDRVSNQLVRELFGDYRNIAKAVDACRSRSADVPGHGVIRLAKFASMGSALTFPVEAMVFLTVIFLGIEDALNRPLTRDDIQSFVGRVRVFGDDIVVPVDYVRSVYQALEAFGARVNRNKSFWTGRFRESCGKEYFAGEDVSIVRVRRLLPEKPTDVQEIISAVSLRNQLYMAGLWQTARFLDDYLGRLIPFPVVAETSPVLGRWSFLGYETQRIHPSLHSPLVKGYVEKSVTPESHLDGIGALLKVLLKQGAEPFVDPKHLERQGRPVAVGIKLRWASPF